MEKILILTGNWYVDGFISHDHCPSLEISIDQNIIYDACIPGYELGIDFEDRALNGWGAAIFSPDETSWSRLVAALGR